VSTIPDLAHSLWALAVLAFGVAVGSSEIIARYKDAPFTALRNVWARAYIAANGGASLVAYFLIVQFDAFNGDQKELLQALAAGFGAAAFFRSALFTVKVGETDVAVGPALFFQILLAATDRQCDRERAKPRSDLVAEIMKGISFERARRATQLLLRADAECSTGGTAAISSGDRCAELLADARER